MEDSLKWLLLFVIICYIYFIPTIIAYKKNLDTIWGWFFINLLIGWTFLGWIVLLLIIVAKDKK
jgi:hypothetical protein